MYFSGILDDMHALCEACEIPLSSLLSLMDVYKKELDYAVLSKLIDVSVHVTCLLIFGWHLHPILMQPDLLINL